ncbi:very short patch repair endonuclease [Bacillus sp. 3255]|uniref:very short patch repair endonuclease n=1 Tax=Bacillus sp. 3255 TaxID=2817904 RepID=UPI002855DC85|nr:very short patch repair endonuclease [Bacillus sp. 3255]MDR6884310.1 DNA mismatch endonuclease (patch repair protein) [Bacillus sp. 3255]
MADKISKEARSKNMSAIRSTHTKLEDTVTNALWNMGFRFRKNVRKLKGKPDIAIKKYKIVIFIDSCFWHFCKQHGHIPKSNTPFWIEKLERNKRRDEDILKYYQDLGWQVLRIWEHDLNDNLEDTVLRIAKFIEDARFQNKRKETD